MDNARKLEKTGKGWWSGEEIASLLGLTPAACAVFCSRATKRRDLIHPKRSLFLLPGWIGRATERERFRICAILETPSYISLSTALSVHGISSQLPQSVCESISPVRSNNFDIEGFLFRFTRLPMKFYFGFKQDGGTFIAEPEKALIDAVYLSSLGRYAFDMSALDLRRLKPKLIAKYMKPYPAGAKKIIREILEKS